MANYHFIGIGGIGMSSLAQILKTQGHNVAGSDRSYDKDADVTIFKKLKTKGIKLLPQDGSGINDELQNVIVSSAIENDNLDIKRAKETDVPIITRADLLANIFNNKFGIAIGGSNGKTTVTAMTGWVLDYADVDPTIIVGGYIKNHLTRTNPGNARSGNSNIFVIEADESDGTIIKYKPDICVLTSISKDHKTIEELFGLFSIFINHRKGKLIFNTDCLNTNKLCQQNKDVITYGIENNADITAKDVKLLSWGSTFRIDNDLFHLNMPGKHNVSNALATISIAKCLNIPNDKTINALNTFKGISSRMEFIGKPNNINVINDYAHNAEKIKAAINAMRIDNKRLIVIFQPHGYGPTIFLKDELIMAFYTALSYNDILIMPEIYYAGGTANKIISSNDLIETLKAKKVNAVYFAKREEIPDYLKGIAKEGDNILVLGARDNTLEDFCYDITKILK